MFIDKFIVFKVRDFLYALNCRFVQEIIRDDKDITHIKRSPNYVSGVINLRGEIVSIINLAVLFDLNKEMHNENPSIIVVGDRDRYFGVLVSTVIDIVSESDITIEASPIQTGVKRDYLSNIFYMNGQLVSILEVEELTKEREAG